MKTKYKVIFSFIFLLFILYTYAIVGYCSEVVQINTSRESVYVYERFTVDILVDEKASKWDLTISYSDNLDLVSGNKNISEVHGTSNDSSLIFVAKKQGSAKINISGVIYYTSNIMNENTGVIEEQIKEVLVDKQIIVVASVKPDSLLHEIGEENEETNCRLKSVTTDTGVISPFFDSDVTSYILIVPDGVTKVNLIAFAESNKTTVEGAGEHEIQNGDEIIICSTSLSGNVRSYIFKVMTGYEVLFQEQTATECLNVIDIGNDTPPSGFFKANLCLDEQLIPIWNMGHFDYRIMKVLTSYGTEEYYAYDAKSKTFVGLFLNIKYDGKQYVYVGTEGFEPDIEFIRPAKEKIYGKAIACYKYDDESLTNVIVLPLYSVENDNIDYYEYNLKTNQIRLISEIQEETEKKEDISYNVVVMTSIKEVDNNIVRALKESLKIRDMIIIVMFGILTLSIIAFFTSIIVHLSYKQQKFDDLFEEDEEFLRFDEK